jgi:hypothetical protein
MTPVSRQTCTGANIKKNFKTCKGIKSVPKLNWALSAIVFLLGMNLVFNACKREDITPEGIQPKDQAIPESAEEEIVYRYQVGGKIVKEEEIDFTDENLFILYDKNNSEVSRGKRIVTALVFPSVKDAIAFTKTQVQYRDASRMTPDDLLAHYELLSRYAEETGAISAFERTGVVPQAYYDYEANYWNEIYGIYEEAPYPTDTLVGPVVRQRNGPLGCTVAEDANLRGRSTQLPPFGTPIFFGLRGKVSSFRSLGIFPMDIIYGRSFYRSARGLFWDWGMTTRNLGSGLDNTNASWGCGGL